MEDIMERLGYKPGDIEIYDVVNFVNNNVEYLEELSKKSDKEREVVFHVLDMYLSQYRYFDHLVSIFIHDYIIYQSCKDLNNKYVAYNSLSVAIDCIIEDLEEGYPDEYYYISDMKIKNMIETELTTRQIYRSGDYDTKFDPIDLSVITAELFTDKDKLESLEHELHVSDKDIIKEKQSR